MRLLPLLNLSVLAVAFYPSLPIHSSTPSLSFSTLDRRVSNLERNSIILSQSSKGSEEEDMILKSIMKRIGKSTSAVVAGTFYAVLAYKRDGLMVSFFIGAISNGILSKVLKKTFNQERPTELSESELDLPPSDKGMPSSHAMSLGFICTFTALQLPWTSLPMLGYVIISLLYRIETKLHTLDQIIVGLFLGTLNALIWSSLCFGANPLEVNIIDFVKNNLLNDQGLLPYYALSIPAIVGALVVGSVERRISRFLKNYKSKED